MHWGDKQSLFVHFSLFFELKSDILFICMDNMCATWSHDFKIYCDWPPGICSLRLLFTKSMTSEGYPSLTVENYCFWLVKICRNSVDTIYHNIFTIIYDSFV